MNYNDDMFRSVWDSNRYKMYELYRMATNDGNNTVNRVLRTLIALMEIIDEYGTGFESVDGYNSYCIDKAISALADAVQDE